MVTSSTPDAYAISITNHLGQSIYWAGQWFCSEATKACRYTEPLTAEKELRRIARLGQAAPRRMKVVPHPLQASVQLAAEP